MPDDCYPEAHSKICMMFILSEAQDIYEVYSIRGFRDIDKYENKQLSLGFNNEKCMGKLHIVWDGVQGQDQGSQMTVDSAQINAGASIRLMSGQVSWGSAGEYQADERAGVVGISWRVSG